LPSARRTYSITDCTVAIETKKKTIEQVAAFTSGSMHGVIVFLSSCCCQAVVHAVRHGSVSRSDQASIGPPQPMINFAYILCIYMMKLYLQWGFLIVAFRWVIIIRYNY
jgi:hypothetical protein